MEGLHPELTRRRGGGRRLLGNGGRKNGCHLARGRRTSHGQADVGVVATGEGYGQQHEGQRAHPDEGQPAATVHALSWKVVRAVGPSSPQRTTTV